MQQPVGAHGAAAVRRRLAGQVGKNSSGLLDDHLQRGEIPERDHGLGGNIHRAFGYQDVRPEIPVGAGPPDRSGQVQESVHPAALLPAGHVGVRKRGVLQRRDLGHPAAGRLGQPPAGPCAAAAGRPPAAAERGRRDNPDDDLIAVHQPDERRPDRHAADVVLGGVDRVDHPAPRARAAPAGLLAEHRVPRPGPAQHVPQRLLGGVVGVRHRRQVRLGLDPEVGGTEPPRGDVVRRVGKHVRETQIIVIARHAAKRYRLSGCRALASGATAGGVLRLAGYGHSRHGGAAIARGSGKPGRAGRRRSIHGRRTVSTMLVLRVAC